MTVYVKRVHVVGGTHEPPYDDGISQERLQQGRLRIPMFRAAEEQGGIPATSFEGLDTQVERATARVVDIRETIRVLDEQDQLAEAAGNVR